MAKVQANGVDLYYDHTGDGEPLILVHGSWGDHNNWAGVTPLLSPSFQVITYDRRGHSLSDSGRGQGSFAEDASDLEALIEQLGFAPAHVVGNSGGAAIALRLAARRPDLFRTLTVHEPPLLGILEGRPEFQPMLEGFNQRIQAVIEPCEPAMLSRLRSASWRRWPSGPEPGRRCRSLSGPPSFATLLPSSMRRTIPKA